MATCDICGNDFPATRLERVPAKRIATLSKQGFVPTQLPSVMKDMVTTDVTLAALWQATVAVNTTDWGICPTCTAEVQGFSAATPGSGRTANVTKQNARSNQTSSDRIAAFFGGILLGSVLIVLLIYIVGTLVAPFTDALDLGDIYSWSGMRAILLGGLGAGLIIGIVLAVTDTNGAQELSTAASSDPSSAAVEQTNQSGVLQGFLGQPKSGKAGKLGHQYLVLPDQYLRRVVSLDRPAFLFLIQRRLQRTEKRCRQRFIAMGIAPDAPDFFEFVLDLRWKAEELLGILSEGDSRPSRAREDCLQSEDDFEETIKDQWFAAWEGYRSLETGDKNDPVAQRKILAAVEIIEGLNATFYKWVREPLVAEFIADLEALEALGPANLDSAGRDPFRALESDARGMDRLHTIDLIRGEAPLPDPPADKGTEIRVPSPSGDPLVDECFAINLRDRLDDRPWQTVPDLAEAQRLQMNPNAEAAAVRMSEILKTHDDFDVIYLWLAGVQNQLGRLPERDATLQAGLQTARSKAAILSAIGVYGVEDKQLHEAVKWLIRSACVQLGGGDANTAFAFLNLAALAEPFQQLDSARQWLLGQADEIDPRHIRFNSVGLDERYQLAISQGTPSDIEAIERLWKFYR